MKNTRSKLLIFFWAFVLGGTSPIVAQDTTYVWQSADGDPFNIQGTIVLDSPSSDNGSGSDVVSFTITDLVDTFSWNPADGLWLSPVSPFAWDSAQILQMDIEISLWPAKNSGVQLAAGPGGVFDFSVLQPPVGGAADQHGEWVAATTVPEPSTIVSLLFGGAMFLAARRYAAVRRPISA